MNIWFENIVCWVGIVGMLIFDEEVIEGVMEMVVVNEIDSCMI